ncbi:MAG: hypothetical protein FWE67_14120 [Planctomycetaceae bacterium]|nr:hypothetical protein [Planctomycetaceae bacterium]
MKGYNLTAKRIFLIWNLIAFVLCIVLVFTLRERIGEMFFGQNNSPAVETVENEGEENTAGENTAENISVKNNTKKSNTDTAKIQRPPRKKKEVNFNDSNASSFSIKGLADTGDVPDEVRFIGTSGAGKRIAFVIDAAEIMGRDTDTRNKTPWTFACDELAFSFKDLNDTQRFQVFFFSDKPDYLQSSQGEAQWLFATPQNKKESFDILKKHVPSSKGSAFTALKEALTLKPDAVFFLITQRSVPLSEAEIAALKTLQGTFPKGVPIHTVEIGAGAESGGKTSFQKLSEMTRGQYRWVDATFRGLLW